VGLSLCVGMLAEVREDDAEGASGLEEAFSQANQLLERAGLPGHREPEDCETWDAQMFGYSGLHYLRRLAAHLDAGLPMPVPGTQESDEDPILQAYFNSVVGKKPGILKRLFGKPPSFSRAFDHLIVHSDAEGFYVPQDFSKVLIASDERLPGGMLGSVPRLLSELDRLAAALELPAELDPESEPLWEAADSQGEGDALWERYGIESFSCVVLREACRRSLKTGAAIVFC